MVSLGTQPANRKSGFGHSSPTGARAQDLSRQPARPDLWGARVSNDPGLPDPSTLAATAGVEVVSLLTSSAACSPTRTTWSEELRKRDFDFSRDQANGDEVSCKGA